MSSHLSPQTPAAPAEHKQWDWCSRKGFGSPGLWSGDYSSEDTAAWSRTTDWQLLVTHWPVLARCRASVQDAVSGSEGFGHLEMPRGISSNRLTPVSAAKAIGFPTSAAAHFMAHQIAGWPQPGAYYFGPCLAGSLQAPEMLFSATSWIWSRGALLWQPWSSVTSLDLPMPLLLVSRSQVPRGSFTARSIIFLWTEVRLADL